MMAKPPVWRTLLRIARTRPLHYAASGLTASVLFYAFPLVTGLILGWIFDRLQAHPGLDSTAKRLLLLLVATTVARFGVMLVAALAEGSMQTIARILVTRNILADVLRRPGARALPSSTGEAIARIRSDGGSVVSYLTWVFDPLGQIVVLGLGVGILFSVEPSLTLTIVLPLIGTLAVVNILSRRIRSVRTAAQEAIGAVSGLLGETFGNVQAVQLAAAEERVVAHLGGLQERRRRTGVRDVVLAELINAFTANAANIATGVVLIQTARGIVSGTFTVGEFALFGWYISWISTIVSMFGQAVTYHRQTGVSLRRLLDLIPGSRPEVLSARTDLHLRGAMPEPAQPPPLDEPLRRFEVRGLTCVHDGGRGVRDVDLSIERGELVVVTGEVGSGKSTLLRGILGLLPRQAGTMRWNETDVSDPATFCVPPRFAYTPQVPRLFSASLRENVLLGLRDRDLGGAMHAAVLDLGPDTKVGPRGVKLSGGEVLRTAAARMFVRTPEVAVFDDLSSALDLNTEQLLWQRNFERDDRPAMLIVSHRPIVLRRADRIILMDNGEVAATGTLAELLDTSQLMRHIYAVDHSR